MSFTCAVTWDLWYTTSIIQCRSQLNLLWLCVFDRTWLLTGSSGHLANCHLTVRCFILGPSSRLSATYNMTSIHTTRSLGCDSPVVCHKRCTVFHPSQILWYNKIYSSRAACTALSSCSKTFFLLVYSKLCHLIIELKQCIHSHVGIYFSQNSMGLVSIVHFS